MRGLGLSVPGGPADLRWELRRLFTVFGQATRADGRPLANAAVQSGRGIGETDQNGYFQIDVAAGDMLSFTAGGAASCEARIGATAPREDFVALGKVICR